MAQIEVSFKLTATDYARMEQVCAERGLSMSEAFTLFAKKVGREGRIPFAVALDPFYSASNMDYLRRLRSSTLCSARPHRGVSAAHFSGAKRQRPWGQG